MRWVRDRRGYGELRLPLRRREARLASWLSGELRRRRRQLLRRHWPLAVGWLASWAALAAGMRLLAHDRPELQGAIVGSYTTLAVTSLWLGLMVLDGSLLARLGRDIEDDVGDALRRCPASYGVVSGLRFERYDVDHVLLSPHGVVAVEVKYLSGQRRTLRRTPRLPDALAQAADGAAQTRRLLCSRGVDLPVLPLLVLAGPGAPELGGELVPAGAIRIAAFRDRDRWLPTLVRCSPARLDLGTARIAADTLLAFQDKRRQYESIRNRPRDSPPTGNRVPARRGETLRPWTHRKAAR